MRDAIDFHRDWHPLEQKVERSALRWPPSWKALRSSKCLEPLMMSRGVTSKQTLSTDQCGLQQYTRRQAELLWSNPARNKLVEKGFLWFVTGDLSLRSWRQVKKGRLSTNVGSGCTVRGESIDSEHKALRVIQAEAVLMIGGRGRGGKAAAHEYGV